MRLRQAVLHPTLVLKRLKENLAAQGKARKDADAGDLELATSDLDDHAIQKMIEKYSASKDGSFGDEVLEGLLEPKEEGDAVEDDSECMLCLEVRSLQSLALAKAVTRVLTDRVLCVCSRLRSRCSYRAAVILDAKAVY